MPARAKRAPDRSDDESDPGKTVLEAQRRISKLRKEKEERLDAVVAECHTALDFLRSRIQDHFEQQRQKSVKESAQHITVLIEKMERRKEIEEEMVDLVLRMHEKMKKVEEMVLTAYDGRVQEMKSVLG